MRSSTARRRSPLTTSCWAQSRTCWRSAALATTSSSSTQPSPSASRRPEACAPTSRKRRTLAPRLAGSFATRSSLALLRGHCGGGARDGTCLRGFLALYAAARNRLRRAHP
eukprot:3938268-Pleurochrysis_carterae.AAC.1